MNKWVFAEIPEPAREQSLSTRLLAIRGIMGDEAVAEFLTPEFSALYSPLLFHDMSLAVNRVLAAREASETVAIIGDYDADGITATALLCRLFAALGMARPVTILPHRLHDGYGLSPELVERAQRAGASLIITVDNGVSGYEAGLLARELGIDLIITDHHRPPDKLPPALAILDPWLAGESYPFRELAGVGMAYKLAAAVLARTLSPAESERFLKWAFDLVAIGTIADVVPLIGENRIFAKLGLTVIPLSKSAGVRSLAVVSKMVQPLDASMVAYRLAPRLNVAGRLADPALALDLLLETDEERAGLMARELDRLNAERKGMVNSALLGARKTAAAAQAAGERLIIIRNSDWQHGIVGLIAAKLCEETRLPVIALSNNGHEDLWVASCRSLAGFDVADFIANFSHLFVKGGGHASAGGFSITADKLALFEEEAYSWAKTHTALADESPTILIDCELSGRECCLETVREVQRLAPFGVGNPEPVFALSGTIVEVCRPIGNQGQHRQLRVRTRDGSRVNGVAFGALPSEMKFQQGERVSLAGNLGVNTWNGQELVRFTVLDARREQD